MPTLIQPDQTWILWAVILGGVALSIWLEQRYQWAAKLSGPVIALCIAMLLANFRIMPTAASVYDVIQGELVPLALPLLLFRASVFQIARTTGWLFLAFHLAAIGTVVGAIVTAVAMRTLLPDAPQIAGIMTGSYIGGAINFYAVASSYGTLIDEGRLGSLLVADNFIMAAMFMGLLVICRSKWVRKHYSHPHTEDAVDSRQLATEHWRRKEIALFDIAASLAVAVTLVALARFTAERVAAALQSTEIGSKAVVEILSNRYVHITFWSTLAATIFDKPLSRIHGAEEIGAYLLYVFLFVIGLPADLRNVFTGVPLMFTFCLAIAAINLLVTFTLGKLLRLDMEHLAIAVNASLGGPPSAAAMAISMGWSKLVLPALLVGIWGYAIGTAIGLSVGELLGRFLAAPE
jgi:uncharacterized membrane protein